MRSVAVTVRTTHTRGTPGGSFTRIAGTDTRSEAASLARTCLRGPLADARDDAWILDIRIVEP